MTKTSQALTLNTSPALSRVKDVHGLVQNGLGRNASEAALNAVAHNFMIGLSPHLVDLIHKTGLDGPVARQYLPDALELIYLPGEAPDPIGDEPHSPTPGVVHRYPDRALLKIASVCAVYCRFCFRRELLGPKAQILSRPDVQKALEYFRNHKDISEIILTGGDPLILSPERLRGLVEGLKEIEHLRVLRIHTRIPVADPERVTPALLKILQASSKAVYICLHINHPDEITDRVETAIRDLRATGAILLSQSVLLKGVNDDPGILATLLRKLVQLQVIPYALYHPDLSRGTGHFRLSLERGREIVSALRGHISGLCQPHYMLDIPGGYGKVEILSSNVIPKGDGLYTIRDYQGALHEYRDL